MKTNEYYQILPLVVFGSFVWTVRWMLCLG